MGTTNALVGLCLFEGREKNLKEPTTEADLTRTDSDLKQTNQSVLSSLVADQAEELI
jgi:hypothetical protein